MASDDLIISVVVPVHNLEASIGEFIDATTAVLREHHRSHELVIVDDGSTDGTTEVVRQKMSADANLRLLVLSRHYGNQIAFTAGLEHAVGDFVVLLSGLFKDPPELIPKLVERARQGADVVYVKRQPGREQPFFRRLAVNAFYRLAGRLTQLELRRDATDFRVLSRRAVNSITKLKEHNRYMPMLYAYVGYDVATIPHEPGRHESIDQRYSYRERIRLAIDAIVAFSDRPLRYVAILSFLVSVAALLGSGVVVLNKLMDEQVVEGWASLMVLLLLMFSLLFLFLAVISEYISRILVESKQRPLYYVREESGGTNFSIGDILDTG